MGKSVLVLEGGAMRSLYTSGVLDVFMNNNIDIDCTVGVSAGALVGSNYVSNQKGRTANININYCKDSKYIGVGAIKNNKGLIGFDYLFGEIAKDNPFDEKEFFSTKKRFVTGVTNCITGKTEYFDKDLKNTYKLLQASSSMPLVSKIVEINGKPYLDGAIDCNVPIDWALDQGFEKIVVVLTRNKEYRKQPLSNKMKKMYNFVYKKYPNLLKTMYDRPNKYNETYDEIEKLERENRIFVFRPKNNVDISRLERDQDKLRDLYEEGIDEAEKQLENLKKYLNEVS